MPAKRFTHLHRGNRTFLYVTALIFLAPPIHAQTDFTRIYGPVDHDVAVPQSTGIYGQIDPAASQEILAHIKAVGAAAWQDMSATGTITYPNGDTNEVDNATLTILNGDSYRLDVTTPNGSRSIRVMGAFGGIQNADGTLNFLLPATSVQGLVTFPQLRVASFPGSQTSIYDRGTLTVDGNPLHRLSIEHPLIQSSVATTTTVTSPITPSGVVTDLYFDPASHLLIKSVASIRLSGLRNDFLQCITYDDYRKTGASLIPFRYTQSLNGQVQWILQLNNVQLNTGLQQASFHF